MKPAVTMSAAVVLLALLACKKDGPEGGADTTECPPCEKETSSEQQAAPKPKLPVGFPATELVAKPGQKVLAPWPVALQRSREGKSARFTLQGGELVEVGEEASVVRNETYATASIPNALILPIPPEDKAEPGDVILLWTLDGTDVDLGLVVEGGTPDSPKAVPINKFGSEPQAKSIPAGSFMKLVGNLQPGTTAACREGSDRQLVVVLQVRDNRVLGLSFSDELHVYAKNECTPLPVKPEVKVGDRVQVAPLGRFREGKVLSLSPDRGLVEVQVEWGSREHEEKVPFGEVAPEPFE